MKYKVSVKKLGRTESSSSPRCGPSNIDDNFARRSDIRRLIKQHFDAAGIQIPYRHLQVVMDQTAENTSGEPLKEAGH